MTRALQRSWNERRWLYAAGVLVLTIIAALLRGSRRDSPLEHAIERHQQETARDTVRIARAVSSAEQAWGHQQVLVVRARFDEAIASSRGQQADSLRAIVGDAWTTADSVIAWEHAYGARTLEVRALESVAALRDTALTWGKVQAGSLHAALTMSEQRADRADSVIRLAVGACRIGRLLPCPSRRTVGLLTAGVVATLAVRYRP